MTTSVINLPTAAVTQVEALKIQQAREQAGMNYIIKYITQNGEFKVSFNAKERTFQTMALIDDYDTQVLPVDYQSQLEEKGYVVELTQSKNPFYWVYMFFSVIFGEHHILKVRL